MSETESARHQLPYLAVAQAYKEITHNEALARIDALLHPVIEGQAAVPPTLLVGDAGQSWLIAVGATGEWQGRDGQIAYWVGGSWRYIRFTEAMRLRNRAANTDLIRIGNAWIAVPSISSPQGGSVIDVEARSAIMALLSHFRTLGQLAS